MSGAAGIGPGAKRSDRNGRTGTLVHRAAPLVGRMRAGIVAVAADGPVRRPRDSRIDAALANARTCYDHFAGRLGVGLADALSARGYLILAAEGGEITSAGAAFLRDFGVDADEARGRRRTFCRPCLDWTERRPHIGGAIGAALAARCFDLGWFARLRGSRALAVTAAGQKGLQEVFGFVL